MSTTTDVSPDTIWKATSTVAAGGAGLAARKLLTSLSDRDAPPNPADRRVAWSEALLWAIGTAVVVAITRTVAQRAAAAAWEAATGAAPPGIED